MGNLKQLTKITNKQIAERGVQALADRPNLTAQYGASGLSAAQLKLWFDKLATYLAEKINEINDAISSEDAGAYIRVCLDEYGYDNLRDLISSFTNGDFAKKVLKLLPSAGATELTALQNIIDSTAKSISELSENKLNKVTATSGYKRAYAIMPDGTQSVILISEEPLDAAIPLYTGGGHINVAIPVSNAQAANKGYTDAQDKLLGANIELSIDTSTYVMTCTLKNTEGKVLSTANIDFPIESMVVSGSYSGGILTLKLKSGEVLNIDISDIIDGLLSVSDFNSGVAVLNGRIDKTNETIQALTDRIELEKIYAHSAYSAEESDTAKNYTKGGKIDKKFREIEAAGGVSLALEMDNEYKLTVSLKNKKGETVSSGMVDLPIESLIASATYSNKILSLTFQSGDKLNIDISDIISGLVPESRKVNGKALTADITITASDVGAYAKDEVFNKTQTTQAISAAKQELQLQINELSGSTDSNDGFTGYAVYAGEAETAANYLKGGTIDRELKKLNARIDALNK